MLKQLDQESTTDCPDSLKSQQPDIEQNRAKLGVEVKLWHKTRGVTKKPGTKETRRKARHASALLAQVTLATGPWRSCWIQRQEGQ